MDVVVKTHKKKLQVSLLIVAKACTYKTHLLKVPKVFVNHSQLLTDDREIALERSTRLSSDQLLKTRGCFCTVEETDPLLVT